MKTRLLAMGLLLALGATGALAETPHYATAATQKQAKQLATAEARATARVSALCYRPARQVGECVKVEGGYRCRAESSASVATCRRAGWVQDGRQSAALTGADRVLWATDSWPTDPWRNNREYSGLYGRTASSVSGPPAAPPFPNN